jgi:hypothetical protein
MKFSLVPNNFNMGIVFDNSFVRIHSMGKLRADLIRVMLAIISPENFVFSSAV